MNDHAQQPTPDFNTAYENFRRSVSREAFDVAIAIMDQIAALPEDAPDRIDLEDIRDRFGALAFERAISELVVVGYMDRSQPRTVVFNYGELHHDQPRPNWWLKEAREVGRTARRTFMTAWRAFRASMN